MGGSHSIEIPRVTTPTDFGLVWPRFDYHGQFQYNSPKTQEAIAAVGEAGELTEEKFDELTRHFIVLAEGNVFTVPHGYGCVMFTALCSTGFVFWAWYKQTQAKRDFCVPHLFSHSPNFMIYNGIYRAYRSTFELHSRFLFHLIFSGLEWPMMSTVAGMSWILARFFYVKAYLRGEPEERHRYWWHCIGFQILHFGALRYALKRLFW